MTKMTARGFANPYNAQGPTNPKYYANREELLSTFIHNVIAVSESEGITRPINISVMGSWGMGKTSTLLKFRDMIKSSSGNAQIFSAYVSLSPASCTDSETFFVYLMESVFRQYESTVALPQKVLDFIREELNVFEKWRIAKISMNPEIERRERLPLRAVNFNETMLRFWEKLQCGGVKLAVIMLDDIHYALLGQGNARLLYDLRTAMQTLSAADTQYMFIITGPVDLYPVIRDKAEPFTRLFERFDLKPFDIEGTRQLIERPLFTECIRLEIDEAVVYRIYQITGGHPYFLTLAMRDILDMKREGRLTLARFERLRPELIRHFARIKFRDDLGRASNTERKLLFQMAVFSSAVAPSELDGSGTVRLLDRLVKKELVVKVARGKYRLYNPLFREYLKNARLTE
ncbi:MAG TPA: P-loop NTPase fold protein [Methanocella sp.]|nr:P-loop NTPase fold protein [Methanocella sp.]